MRALTVKHPHCWAICYGGKDVENRTWPIPASLFDDSGSAWAMLHAAQRWDGNVGGAWVREGWMAAGATKWTPPALFRQAEFYRPNGRRHSHVIDGRTDTPVPFGAIVAVVEFTGCHAEGETGRCAYGDLGMPGQVGPCSVWAQRNANVFEAPMWHWEIGRVVVLDDPVPAKGRLGPWTPDADVTARVLAQVA